MKRRLSLTVFSLSVLFTGCLEITQEITINKDGSGTLSRTADLSQMLVLSKKYDGQANDQTRKKDTIDFDSTFQFKSLVDSMKNLSPADKDLLKAGAVHATMKVKEDKFLVNFFVPFKKIGDLDKTALTMLEQINGEFLDVVMSGAVKSNNGPGDSAAVNDQKNIPHMSLPENYFTLTCKDGMISRMLNKEKIKSRPGDFLLSEMKEMGSAEVFLNTNLIIHLPRPAKKAVGKKVKLSGDKKTLTIKNELNDLFDDPSLYEFKVEY